MAAVRPHPGGDGRDLLDERKAAPRDHAHFADEVALSGSKLVVLTETKMLEVYDWTTGKLVHTWPVATTEPGRRAIWPPRGSSPSMQAGRAARKLHVIRLATGKDVVVATGKGSGYWNHDAAMSSHGLVYAVNYSTHGKLVFVPMAKLLAKVS